jgi:hypothetical protein
MVWGKGSLLDFPHYSIRSDHLAGYCTIGWLPGQCQVVGLLLTGHTRKWTWIAIQPGPQTILEEELRLSPCL